MAVTNTTALANDFQTYIASKLIDVASRDTVFKRFGMTENLPSGNSKTMSFTRYPKLAQTSTLLTEGVTPTDTALTTNNVSATVDQLGAYVTLTDLGELTVRHNLVQQTINLLGMQAAESIDTIIIAVLVAGTQVQYAAGRGSRAAITAADVMTTSEFRKARKLLLRNGAPFYEGGNYVMVVDPEVEADILADTTFTQASSYSAINKLEQAEIGTWLGIKVFRSNNLQTIASTVTVHTSFVFGQGAFASVDLQNLQTYVEGPGGNADPLHQRRTIGWKVSWKSVILENLFMLRIETASNY